VKIFIIFNENVMPIYTTKYFHEAEHSQKFEVCPHSKYVSQTVFYFGVQSVMHGNA